MEIPKKEFKIGNTTIVIHSKLVLMTKEEQRNWFETEKAKGNKVLKEIEKAVNACYLDS